MTRIRLVFSTVVCLAIFVTSAAALPASGDVRPSARTSPSTVDYQKYIDANRILMFITNTGELGRDVGGVFGNDYGTYFPFVATDYVIDGSNIKSPLYAFGLWMGGKVNDSLRVALAEYASEYVPGPMAGGTFQTDRPEFRVYKLYADSLESNPSADYLAWPTDQGAPLDRYGKPFCPGDQTLWTVYNDADPDQHNGNVDAGETAPLGVEVQQTIWASDEEGGDTITVFRPVTVTQMGHSTASVTVDVRNPSELTGHSYMVVTTAGLPHEVVWHLVDLDLGDTVLSGVIGPLEKSAVIEAAGLSIQLNRPQVDFADFAVVANGDGLLDPPAGGALDSAGFPSVTPDERQQVGDGLWAIHVGDNGGSSGGGTRGDYAAFVSRVTRNGAALEAIGLDSYEIRFTGTNDHPLVSGGWAADLLTGNAVWVPFELWNIGSDSTSDPSDDYRIVPCLYDLGMASCFDLSSFGSQADGTCSGSCEHSASSEDDDPYTDLIFWYDPADRTPGESGYLSAEAAVRSGNWGTSDFGPLIFSHMTLINWNGGVVPPFTQAIPEQGTVFRITMTDSVLTDSFAFSSAMTPQAQFAVGPLATTVFVDYKLYNKSDENISDFYLSIWTDPDLGTSGDDLVGCDTLHDLFFCYNGNESDQKYSPMPPPACGFRVLAGPVVASPGDTAYFFGHKYPNHANSHMASFNRYINGTDPDNAREAYWFMQGLDAKHGGAPYVFNGDTLRFVASGDPVAGTGDIDMSPDEKRMMASFGPLDFPAGDSQEVVVAFAVGAGSDRLASITKLKNILISMAPLYEDSPTGVEDNTPGGLPAGFIVAQNYPNPFNPTTTIEYSLPARCEVTVEVFNVLGQKTATVFKGDQPAGPHTVHWNGTDDQGNEAASGIYFYRVSAGDNVTARKMILLR